MWATVHGVAKSQTRLSDSHTHHLSWLPGSGMQTGMVGTLYLCSTASVAPAGLWKAGGGGRCQLGPRGPLVRNTRGLCASWASSQGFPGGTSGKESSCRCRRHGGLSFHSWVGKIPWRRKWQPTPVFLPGEFCGQRSLAGYSLQGHKELYTTDHTHHTTRRMDTSSPPPTMIPGETYERKPRCLFQPRLGVSLQVLPSVSYPKRVTQICPGKEQAPSSQTVRRAGVMGFSPS